MNEAIHSRSTTPERYESALNRQPWLADSTKAEYRTRANIFLSYCAQFHGYDSIEQLAGRFLTYLRIKGLSPERVTGFETVVRQVIELENVTSRTAHAKDRLTVEQAYQLLEAANNSALPRDAAVMSLMLLQGLSLNECRHLKVTHTEDQLGPSFITDSNNRRRQVELRPDVMRSVQRWLESPQRRAVESEYVFAASNAGPLSRTAVDNQIRRLGFDLGMVVTPQMVYRASFSISSNMI